MSRNLPYNRADRIAEQVYQIVAEYIYKNIEDGRLTGLQVTSAKMTRDLSIVRIYFYIEGGQDKKDKALTALEEIKPAIRHHIGQEIVLKKLPKIEFYIDKGFENAERVEKILKTVKNQE